jgi:aspartyl-tRNA(Asn)/glutamyl-tRNA(Gln) amidotransferase subunit A
MENEYYFSILTLSKSIREQKISPTEVVDMCLQRINDLNPELNAFITVLANQAREQAVAAEAEIKAGKWRGPLHGIPVGIKDFYDTAGIKTTAAFQYFKDRTPKKDAKPVIKLKEAGAIIIGKMNMHKLGMGTTGLDSYFGAIHNPWNTNYIAGGSSAGSAAAVASGLCYATLDTDAIGSCRLPAACCGVVGFKGTYNLISTKGILEGEQPPGEMILWLSHAGITTRYVDDTAIILDILANGNEHTKNQSFFKGLSMNRKLRIGVVNNFKAEQVVQDTFAKVVEVIRGLGHEISSVPAPFSNFADGIQNIEADRKGIAGRTFEGIDILLLPTIPTSTPTIKKAGSDPQALSPENTAFANYYGLPAISVPCGFDANKLPMGLQMIGKPWDDASVLQLARQYQIATEKERKYPVI